MKMTDRRIAKYWPLALAVAILWLTIAVLQYKSLSTQDGTFVYTQDDAYIHMAMAKNMATHGNWGVNAGEFQSASSSPLWVLMLSFLYLFFGVNVITPFLMNIVFVTLTVVAAYFILRQQGIQSRYNFLVLLGLIFIASLPPLVMLGMEHSLHILLTLLFVYLATLVLTSDEKGSLSRNAKWLLVVTPFFALCRYESLVIIGLVFLMILLKKRWLLALSVLGLAALPVGIFGLISIRNGAQFLPNSVELKTGTPLLPFAAWLKTNIRHAYLPVKRLVASSLFLNLGLASGLILFLTFGLRKAREWNQVLVMNSILILAVFFHFQNNPSPNYRYDAYLISLGIIAISIPLFRYIAGRSWPGQKRELLLLAVFSVPLVLLFMVPFLNRSYINHKVAPLETRRTYEQHMFMSEFVNRYYSGKGVALNDIGAINYYADISSVDLWGLGTNEIARERMDIRAKNPAAETFVLSEQQIDDITRSSGTDIAMLYHEIFEIDGESRIPDNWVLVGRWLCYRYERDYYDKVSFYAVKPEEVEMLKNNLREFAPELPPNVIQEGLYTEGM
ncbi:MAG: hypothetical protein Q7K29_01505 [Thermoleophilia bacterium]|nr:hypothetical protein [Thermoleophilia bacterium]